MKNIRDAAIYASLIIFIKLLYRIIPPSNGIKKLFDAGVWAGLGAIFAAYIIVFLLIYIVLVIKRKNKRDGNI
ncbi:MAG TPA: hypothetical protein VK067_00145 [Pseudogracilibacillus sp.]|nr:hypothetical protein [Pseudogracilibacillus sp.]